MRLDHWHESTRREHRAYPRMRVGQRPESVEQSVVKRGRGESFDVQVRQRHRRPFWQSQRSAHMAGSIHRLLAALTYLTGIAGTHQQRDDVRAVLLQDGREAHGVVESRLRAQLDLREPASRQARQVGQNGLGQVGRVPRPAQPSAEPSDRPFRSLPRHGSPTSSGRVARTEE